jgi:hypothetical protein
MSPDRSRRLLETSEKQVSAFAAAEREPTAVHFRMNHRERVDIAARVFADQKRYRSPS